VATPVEGNVLIGQSGGPTSVINASLAGVVQAAAKRKSMGRILGMRYGIEGFMEGKAVDLGAQDPQVLQGLKTTPSSALGSCRHKVQDDDLPRILEMLRKHEIRYLFLIGGNDTMDTIHRIEAHCAAEGHPLYGVGIPKTVDNDLYGTDHTPGYPSAARYVALSVLQAGLLARDMQRVDQFVVHQTVGREAGWLAAAAALAGESAAEAPHIILLPEVAFDRDRFLEKAEAVQKRHGFVYIVAGEGVTHADGSPVSASTSADKFSNVEFGAMGGASVAMQLHRMLADAFGWRGEFQICESLPMCAADRASRLDVKEAAACGRKAVALAAGGTSGVMVTIDRKGGPGYGAGYGTAPLAEVAVRAKQMPKAMIRKDGFHVTKTFLDYARPLVGELPQYVTLDTRR
jgi:6-phosphofructokinase 1